MQTNDLQDVDLFHSLQREYVSVEKLYSNTVDDDLSFGTQMFYHNWVASAES